MSLGQIPKPVPPYEKIVPAPVGDKPAPGIDLHELGTDLTVGILDIIHRDIDSVQGAGALKHSYQCVDIHIRTGTELDGIRVGQSLFVWRTDDYASLFNVYLVHFGVKLLYLQD